MFSNNVVNTPFLSDVDEDLPTLAELQGGLLGERQHEKAFMRLTLRLFNLALADPGFPDDGPKVHIKNLNNNNIKNNVIIK